MSRKGRGRPRHPDVLTPAEWKVTDAVRHGMSNPQIARRSGVSVDAIKFHVANSIAKLGLADRIALRAWPGVPANANAPEPDRERKQTMTGLQLGPLGQISRHVTDIDRAAEWYGKVLGLPHLYTFGDLAFFDCGGTRLFLSVPSGGTPASTTILYFRVPHIHHAYQELRSRGVRFAGAPHMIHRHDSGIEEWMAFFDDPDGQPLAIMAQVAPGPAAADA